MNEVSNPPPGIGPPPGLLGTAAASPAPAPAAAHTTNNATTNGNVVPPGGIITAVKAQIGLLLSRLSEESFKSRVGEIKSLCDHHGPEIYHHFLRKLISSLIPQLQSPTIPDQSDLTWRLLEVEGRRLARDVLLSRQLAVAIEANEGADLQRTFSLETFANIIQLNASERISLGSGVTLGSNGGPLSEQGRHLVANNIDEGSYILSNPTTLFFGDADISPGMGTLLLNSLLQLSHPSQQQPLLSSFQRSKLLSAFVTKFGLSCLSQSLVSLPLPIPGVSLADWIVELGDISDPEVFGKSMLRWGLAESEKVEEDVMILLDEVLRKLVATSASLPFNGSSFSQALYEVTNNTVNWTTVIATFGSSTSPLLSPAAGYHPAAELILCGLVQAPKPWSDSHAELAKGLFETFLIGRPNSSVILSKIWALDMTFFLEGIGRFYSFSDIHIGRIVDIGQELEFLDTFMGVRPYHFALDVASNAQNRAILNNLEQWLESSFEQHGSEFATSAINFLRHKVICGLEAQENGTPPQTSLISQEVIAIILRSLYAAANTISPEDLPAFNHIKLRCFQLHPMLLNLLPSSPDKPGMVVTKLEPDLEEAAMAFFGRLYEISENAAVDGMVEELNDYRVSKDEQQMSMFAAVIYTLLEENRFVPGYPKLQQIITGKFLGSLIQHRVLNGIALDVALLDVQDALKISPESPNSNFNFGINALRAFQSRLHEFPDTCHGILEIQYMNDNHPEVIEFVRTTLADREATETSLANEMAKLNNVKPVFTALHLEAFKEMLESPAEPDKATSDRIIFIVNNLAPNNFEVKTQEMKDAFQKEHSRWFAHYFVVTRVAAEINNHSLYMKFVEALKDGFLEKHVLYETFIKIHSLLNAESTVSSAPDRATLKNLGSWLGRFTLARNKPIRHRHLSFKDLLIEGYDSKRLIVAIPFVCKVLDQCAQSKVFHPPNPWLMAVIKLLVEFYQHADLKLNLKFEIEVLCKSLNIDLAQIEPTSYLRSRPVEATSSISTAAPNHHLQDLSALGYSASNGGDESGIRHSSLQPYQSEAAAQAAQLALNRRIDELISELPQYLVFLADSGIFATNNTLKRVVHLAVERAIREIVIPVVDRSVTIAGTSAKDLITKDFATESSVEKMRTAAHLMVQDLAGNLATVTCKEPLRQSITSNIRTLLQQNGFNEASIPGDAVTNVVSNNLDIACAVIKKAAQDKAVVEIDEAFSATYEARRKHRERSSQPFWDGVSSTINLSSLPELLRIRPNGLQSLQLDVYEEFGKHRVNQSSPPPPPSHLDLKRSAMQAPGLGSTRGFPGYQGSSPLVETAFEASHPQVPTSSSNILSSEQSILKFQQILAGLEKYFMDPNPPAFSSLPPGHEIRVAIRSIPVLAANSFNRDETSMSFSQKIVQSLYKTESPLAREVYVSILHRLCELFNNVQKEVVNWLTYREDERKFVVPVTIALARAGLLDLSEQDVQLAQMLARDPRPSVVNYCTGLIQECLLSEAPVTTRAHLVHTIEALSQLGRDGHAPDSTLAVLEGLAGARSASDNDAGKRERLALYFSEWNRIFQHAPSLEAAFLPYVTELQNQGILKGEEITFLFFRVCAEKAVEHYAKFKNDLRACVVTIDALSKLIVLMFKNFGDPHGDFDADDARIRYLNKIVSIVVLVVIQNHEEAGLDFDQRPFFRFFSSLFNDLASIQFVIQGAYMGCLRVFSNTLTTLQPTLLPGFAFSWMSLISHRSFMPALLQGDKSKNWPEFHGLLLALFKFLSPFLLSAKMHDSSRVLMKGTIRILLVLLHDFPDFLAEYHHSLCDAIPTHCIQLRNLILSSFPPVISLPDPLTCDFSYNAPETRHIPRILSDITTILSQYDLVNVLEDCVHSKQGINAAVYNLRPKIATESPDGFIKYNTPLLNAVVLYVGNSTVESSVDGDGRTTLAFDANSPGVAFLQSLASDPDPEGIYNAISAMANQLRFPNAHTWFYSHLILHLFTSWTPGDKVPEIIARVLLERVVVARPHPWGVLFTFMHMLRLPNFWTHPFTTSVPELNNLFRHCLST